MNIKIKYIKGKSILAQYYKLKALRDDVPDDVTRTAFYRSIRQEYGLLFDDIIKALREHKPEIDVGTKALNYSAISAIITTAVAKRGIVQAVVDTVVSNVKKGMLSTIKDEATTLDLGFDAVREADAIARLTERKMSYYADIPDTLTDTVIQTLTDTISQGGGWTDAVEKLLVLREDFTTHRAETIVRTEIGRSRREAKAIFADEYQDMLDKKWLSAHDERTRPSHFSMDGKVIGARDNFIVNYSLDNPKYPRDVQERYPGESKYGINCRCNMVLVKKQKRE